MSTCSSATFSSMGFCINNNFGPPPLKIGQNSFQMLRLSGLAAQQFPRPTGYTSHCADTPEHPCLPCNIGIEVLSDFEGGSKIVIYESPQVFLHLHQEHFKIYVFFVIIIFLKYIFTFIKNFIRYVANFHPS